MPGRALQTRILEKFHINGEPSVFFAKDLEEAERIRQAARRAATLAEPISITAALPPGQKEKEPLIAEISRRIDEITSNTFPQAHTYGEEEMQELHERLARVKRTSIELSLIADLFYEPETIRLIGEIRDTINRIDQWLGVADPSRLTYLDGLIGEEVQNTHKMLRAMTRNTSVQIHQLPKELVERVKGKDGTWVVLVRANNFVFEETFLNAHVDELRSIHDNVTGLVPAWKRMLEKILRDIPFLTGLTFLAVFILVFIGLRSPVTQ